MKVQIKSPAQEPKFREPLHPNPCPAVCVSRQFNHINNHILRATASHFGSAMLQHKYAKWMLIVLPNFQPWITKIASSA